MQFYDGQVIGRLDEVGLDPPMGVAGGRLAPSPAYDRLRHATSIEGEHNADADQSKLSARVAGQETVECEGIAVEDYWDGLGEIEVTLLGIPNTDYEAYFGEHPHYKAYYSDDE